jgi:hypothetical protein
MYGPYGQAPAPAPASAPPTPVQPTQYHYTPPQNQNQYGQQAPPFQQPQGHYAVAVVDMSPPTDKEMVWTVGRTIKWIAVIDTVFSLIYAFVLWPYLFAAFFSLSGWYGAKNFRPNFIILYIIYQFFTIAFRIFLIYYRPSTGGIILGIISVLIEAYIIQITIKFRKLFRNLSWQNKRELQQGWQPDRRMQVAYY